MVKRPHRADVGDGKQRAGGFPRRHHERHEDKRDRPMPLNPVFAIPALIATAAQSSHWAGVNAARCMAEAAFLARSGMTGERHAWQKEFGEKQFAAQYPRP